MRLSTCPCGKGLNRRSGSSEIAVFVAEQPISKENLNRNCVQKLHHHALLHLQRREQVANTIHDQTQVLCLQLVVLALLQLQLRGNEIAVDVLSPTDVRVYSQFNELLLLRISSSIVGFLKQRSSTLLLTHSTHSNFKLALMMPTHMPKASPSLKPTLKPSYSIIHTLHFCLKLVFVPFCKTLTQSNLGINETQLRFLIQLLLLVLRHTLHHLLLVSFQEIRHSLCGFALLLT